MGDDPPFDRRHEARIVRLEDEQSKIRTAITAVEKVIAQGTHQQWESPLPREITDMAAKGLWHAVWSDLNIPRPWKVFALIILVIVGLDGGKNTLQILQFLIEQVPK